MRTKNSTNLSTRSDQAHAPIVDRSVVATRQLASRARRRVQGQAPIPDTDLRAQRRVVDAFLAAAQAGDFEGLVAVLDPHIVLRADAGMVKGMSRLVRGAQAVAGQAAAFSKMALSNQVVLVNGNIGLVCRLPDGRLFSVIGFTIADGRVVEMDILADPDRLRRLDLSAVERRTGGPVRRVPGGALEAPSGQDVRPVGSAEGYWFVLGGWYN